MNLVRTMAIKSIIFTVISLFSAQAVTSQSFNDLFKEAQGHLELGHYDKALPVLLEMEKIEPDNANTAFSIGYCYSHSALEKQKSIAYFEKAVDQLTISYRMGNPNEKKAPVETIRFLGQAYHTNYEFDKALEQYMEYKELVENGSDPSMLEEINRDIEITNYAKELVANPIPIFINKYEEVNTKYADYRPKVNAEENVMFLTSRRKGGSSSDVDDEDKYFEDIYMSVKDFGRWQKPVLVEGLNSSSHDACLYLSPDGQTVYLYRNGTDGETGESDGGIYESHLNGDQWSEPKLLTNDINSKHWETDASLNAFGNMIFFTSDRPGGKGGRDIWMITKKADGKWSKVENLEETINTPFDEEAPYLHPDGKTLYFSSKGHKTMGGFDVFKSTLEEDGTWGTPENLGYPINTTGDDVFFFPSVDGQRAYFSSYREGGKGDQDIYVMTLEEQVEKTLAVYKGTAKDTLGMVVPDLEITIIDDETGELVATHHPNEITGEFLFILQSGKQYTITYELDGILASEKVIVNEEGGVQRLTNMIINEGDGLVIRPADYEDEIVKDLAREEEATLLEVTDIDVVIETDYTKDRKDADRIIAQLAKDSLSQSDVTETLSSGETLVLKNVMFVYESTQIIDKSEAELAKIVAYLKANPEQKILISGHTDSRGDDKYNQWLSSARANAIRNYLDEQGIDFHRMKTIGYGESKPIAENTNPDGSDNPEGRQLNRRVEFKIIK